VKRRSQRREERGSESGNRSDLAARAARAEVASAIRSWTIWAAMMEWTLESMVASRER
jgi:hypothetical protein